MEQLAAELARRGSESHHRHQQKRSAACAPFLLVTIDGREITASCQRTKGANRKEQLAAELARRGSESHHRHQISTAIMIRNVIVKAVLVFVQSLDL
ncbi:MAG: hypothetical protein E7610_04190 [Ruminococcaceae bacterium]|nr:hypothetical protein [Oscillospiraceae bacterium]